MSGVYVDAAASALHVAQHAALPASSVICQLSSQGCMVERRHDLNEHITKIVHPAYHPVLVVSVGIPSSSAYDARSSMASSHRGMGFTLWIPIIFASAELMFLTLWSR